jgi:YQGE family putative transporter
MRLFLFINGLFNGVVIFVPIVMVLSFVGKEDALGIVQSLSSVIAAIIIYSIGKKITREQRLWIFGGYVFFSIMASLSFATLYSMIGVFLFFGLNAIAQPLNSISWGTLYFDSIEKENVVKENHYSHIFDAEIFINSGRVIGILVFLLFIHFASVSSALRYTLLIFTISLPVLFMVARSIEREHKAQIATDLVTEVI